MASSSDEATVTLVLANDPSATSQVVEATLEDELGDEISISASDIQYWDLSRILRSRIVKVHANRRRLAGQSSYFRGLLEGSFSESNLFQVSIQWDLETAVNVLKLIHGLSIDITLTNFLRLLEGALFFGVEKLLSECEAWFYKTTSTEQQLLQIPVDAIIEIWNFSLEHNFDFIAEQCTGYLAQNFVMATSSDSFTTIPYNLLHLCLEHPQLTVDSEKQLCEALLCWVMSNEKLFEYFSNPTDGSCKIFEKVRLSLLPLQYVAGKRRSKYFSEFADKSIYAILDLLKDGVKHFSSLDDKLENFQIRLTKYSKKVKLQGCPQIMAPLLFLSVLPPQLDTGMRKRALQALTELYHNRRDFTDMSQEFMTVSFDNVHHVDMSKCPNLQVGASIMFLHSTFPSMKTLKYSHCTSFSMSHFYYLMQKCPLLKEVDLAVGFSPVVPTKVSIVSNFTVPNLGSGAIPQGMLVKSLSLARVEKLTLEGRKDLDDHDLSIISMVGGSLAYINLKGCTLLSDDGIAKLLCQCTSLHALIVSYTSFGRNSISAICSSITPSVFFDKEKDNKEHLHSVAARLEQLHIDGCNGINQVSMSHLIDHMLLLKSFSASCTCLSDDALCKFKGVSLGYLDISETMISRAALAHVIGRNTGLKSLKASGCHNFHPHISGVSEEISDVNCSEDLFYHLGQKCQLEELTLGWGFSYLSLEKLTPAIRDLRAISLGIGTSLSHESLSELPRICPLLESLVFVYQVISDKVLKGILELLRNLKVLCLCQCLGDLTSQSLHYSMSNIRTLKLEWVTPWMTNDDLVVLTQNSPSLVELSLSGCKLLDTDAQQILSSGWPGLTLLHLEDCGNVTSNGVPFILECKALEDLLLRHSGRGIRKNFITEAASKLPLLRVLALDLCDACEQCFEGLNADNKFFLSTLKIARCESQMGCFDLAKLGAFRRVHNVTIVLEWNGRGMTTTTVKERL